jgi:hypothetical protein
MGRGLRWSPEKLAEFTDKAKPAVKSARKTAGKGPKEHDIQAGFVQWVRDMAEVIPALGMAFAVPNGAILGGDERLRAIQMGKLKREGFEPGVPDWCFPQPRGKYAGLWIEFKTQTGRLNENQDAKIKLLQAHGHLVHVCRSADEAIGLVEAYLTLDPLHFLA